MGVRGVTDLMIMPGLINLDFADIRTVMSEMGKAMMGTGEAEGERRSIEAAEAAISNPLLDEVSMQGARAVLINITGGLDMTLFEVDAAANRIREEVDPNANIIFGSTFSESMQGRMRVSVVATGILSEAERARGAATAPAAAAEPQRVAPIVSPVSVFRFPAAGQRAASVAPPPAASAPVVPRPSARPAEPAPPPAYAAAVRPETSAEPEAPKASGLREMFRGFGLSRQPPVAAPLRPGRPSEAAEPAGRAEPLAERDELGDIPAFLRRERETV
jgi:cell division protein FtsZ